MAMLNVASLDKPPVNNALYMLIRQGVVYITDEDRSKGCFRAKQSCEIWRNVV